MTWTDQSFVENQQTVIQVNETKTYKLDEMKSFSYLGAMFIRKLRNRRGNPSESGGVKQMCKCTTEASEDQQ